MCRYPLKRNQVLRVRVDPISGCLIFLLEETLGSRKIAKPYAFLTDPDCWEVFDVALHTLQRGLKFYRLAGISIRRTSRKWSSRRG